MDPLEAKAEKDRLALDAEKNKCLTIAKDIASRIRNFQDPLNRLIMNRIDEDSSIRITQKMFLVN